jgi:4-nitrophenyl phosphatase
LTKIYPQGCPVYIVGEEGLRHALNEKGFIESNQNVQAVIVGMDWNVTYQKLKTATQLIRAGAQFIATNTDKTFPTPEGLIPGAGALVAAIEAATDQKPVVIGKPSPIIYELVLDQLGIPAAQTLAIGDRLETDIAGGQITGCRTALVLSGISDRQAADKWKPSPDIIAPDLASILFD